MKGVSAVIATILMLIITIALAGMAYMYIQGIFVQKTQGIEVSDAYCVENGQAVVTAECLVAPCDQSKLTVRNIGTASITLSGITFIQTGPSADTVVTDGSWGAATTLEPAQSATWTNTCGGTGGRSCYYRISPPIGGGGALTASVYCT